MGKRLHTTVQSYEKVDYSIEIHDTDFTGTSIFFSAENLSLNFNAAGQSRLNEIITATLNITILIKNATQESFITDLIGANESRFNIVFKKGSTTKFVGYIITDSVQKENMSYPFSFGISAVDGLARLKSLDYNNAGNAYSGKATITEHLNNIVSQIGLSSLAGTTITKALEWVEDSHASGADILDNTRFDHSLFTKQDSNGNNQFINPFAVLKEINKTFLARFLYWDGAYHFQQINKYFTLSDYDINADKANRGGIWQYLPALRQSKVIFKYGETLNIAQGLGLTQDSTTGSITGNFKNNDQFVLEGTLQYKTSFSAAFLSANGVKSHRVKFGVMLQMPSNTKYYYLTRTSGTSDFYKIQNGEIGWTEDVFTSKHYYEIYGDIINEFNYNFNKQITFNIETPTFPGIDHTLARLEIVNFHIIKPDGGFYASPDIELTWSLFNANIQQVSGNSAVKNYEKIFTADNSTTGNSKTITVETKMGDVDITTSPAKLEIFDGTEWQDSNAWTKGSFSAVPIGQLLANEILAGQNKHIEILQHTLIMSDFSPLHRVSYKGVKYMFLRGTWTPEKDEVAGEWVEVALDETGVTEGTVITGDGSTNTDPSNPNSGIKKEAGDPIREVSTGNTDDIIKNLPITLLDLVTNAKGNLDINKDIAITQISVDGLPTSTNLNEGDKIQIVHPVTGFVETVTLAANVDNISDTSRYIGGNTTLYINSFTPSQNFPTGSFLVKDVDASPLTITDKVFKALAQTGSYTDIDFDLPTTQIDERLHVQRDIYLMIYDVHFSITTNMGGDRRRITWLVADLDNENILVKLKV